MGAASAEPLTTFKSAHWLKFVCCYLYQSPSSSSSAPRPPLPSPSFASQSVLSQLQRAKRRRIVVAKIFMFISKIQTLFKSFDKALFFFCRHSLVDLHPNFLAFFQHVCVWRKCKIINYCSMTTLDLVCVEYKMKLNLKHNLLDAEKYSASM